MGRHRKLRTQAWLSRWRWPLLFGGASAAMFLLNTKQARASEVPAGSSPAGGTLGMPINAGGAPTSAPVYLPGTFAPTGAQTSASTALWETLQPVAGLDSGYINFPSGAQAAAALFQTRMDEYGQYYVQWGGITYVLGSMDGMGNWTALRAG